MNCKKLHKMTFLVISIFSANACFGKSPEPSPELSLICETRNVFFSYADNSSYLKDLHSHTKELYSERFIIDFPSQNKAIKKHVNDVIEDENYSVIKTGSLYKLKSINGTDDISVVIDLKSRKYSSISEKHDALIKIKATGTCERK